MFYYCYFVAAIAVVISAATKKGVAEIMKDMSAKEVLKEGKKVADAVREKSEKKKRNGGNAIHPVWFLLLGRSILL